jgi:hypothetical protein
MGRGGGWGGVGWGGGDTWQETQKLGTDLEKGKVANHTVLLPPTAEKAQHLLHGGWGALGFAGGVHLKPHPQFHFISSGQIQKTS